MIAGSVQWESNNESVATVNRGVVTPVGFGSAVITATCTATGHKPAGSEIDASIIYADYYYLEALLRLKRVREHNAPLSELALK